MKHVLKILTASLYVIALLVVVITAFFAGYLRGYGFGQMDAQKSFQDFLSDKTLVDKVSSTTKPIPTASLKTIVVNSPPKITWGGPQLWDAVNKRRVELGVNQLSVREEICTIASIRLNQLLELGKLDGHVGFSNMPTDRPDLKWIFEKYNLSEFLVSGATSPQNAVDLWENTLGHKELLSGGQYVWGCIYAQNGFGVAIAAY